MLATSLKSNELQITREMASVRALLPLPPSWDNYKAVLKGEAFGTPWVRFFLNTCLIVASVVIMGVVVNSMAAFALARLRFRGRGVLVSAVVALIILPFEGLAVPLFLIINRFGWFDSFQAQIIPFIAHPFSIFLFYQFFNKLPRDLDEAAKVDGASWWQIYWKIVLPLSRPVIATVAILQSLEYWNSFLWPLMVTRGPEFRPLSVAMNTFFGLPPRQWGDVMAFAFLTAMPLLVLYLAFQRWFVQSVAQSGLKG
ncbi:carbohydrate ABC transporter permease [Candidatus Bipolaricaulota bacterium]|nr:carbohydrate ABC transporter permease [Candidatus Bipolaricaulota bacterium]